MLETREKCKRGMMETSAERFLLSSIINSNISKKWSWVTGNEPQEMPCFSISFLFKSFLHPLPLPPNPPNTATCSCFPNLCPLSVGAGTASYMCSTLNPYLKNCLDYTTKYSWGRLFCMSIMLDIFLYMTTNPFRVKFQIQNNPASPHQETYSPGTMATMRYLD